MHKKLLLNLHHHILLKSNMISKRRTTGWQQMKRFRFYDVLHKLLNITQCSLLLPAEWVVHIHIYIITHFSLSPNARSDQHVQAYSHTPSMSSTSDLGVFVNEVLHRTGYEISKRNIIKPPQSRGSKKMGPLKTRLSLKESINLMLDRKERMREKSGTQVRTQKAVKL